MILKPHEIFFKIYIKSKIILDFSCDLLIKYTMKNINTSYVMIQG